MIRQKNTEELETLKVAAIAFNCQSSITNLLAAATREGCCVRDFLHSRDVQEMQDRFNQWVGNLGALQTSESPLSIEHRLRDAPLVRKSILNSLKDLHSSVQAATDIALGKRRNRITEPRGTESDIDLSEYDLSSSESDSSSVLSSGGRSILRPTTEMKELMSAIRTGLDSLFKTSIFIRKFASKDKRLRAAETKPFDSRADIMYITDRYPLLKQNATLATRLGEANARRRQYFKYRRDHYERLSTVATKGDSVNVRAQAQPIVRIAAPAKTVLTAETKPSLLADTEATAFMADEAALDRMLETPGVPEAMSAVSFATSVAETSDEELAFPSVPVEAESGSPFLCPCCFQYQQLRREGLEYQWRKHVLQDLEPYICTFSSCGLETFESQRAWFEHELLSHRSRWMCSECFTNFASSDDLKGHVNQDHSGLVSTRQLTAFVDQSKRLVESIQPSECPFCDDSWAQADSSLASREEVLVVDLDQFRRHLGKHLQQVALFSLPRLTHDHDQSLGPHGDAEYSDRDAIPKGCQWIRDDCGRGWSIVLRKRTTFVALASFLNLCRMKSHTHEKPYPLVPLLASLERVDEELVQLLCAPGADFILGGPNGNSLQTASEKGHEGIVRLLLNYEAEVDAQAGPYGNALQTASAEGRKSMLQLLRNYEADFHGAYGSVLQEAPNVRNYIVKLLLNHKADVNAQGGPYGNALQAASSNGHDQIVQLLLSHQADVNAQGGPYGSALQAASLMGHDQIVQLLLSHKADVNAQGGPYGSALQAASFHGYNQIVQLLLNHKVDVNAQGGPYGSALQAASFHGYNQIVKLLLNHKVDVNAQGRKYGSALQTASSRGHDQIVQLLLSHKADVNARGGSYGSALQAASFHGHDQIVRLLLSHKADVNAQGGMYGNALQAASSKGHTNIMRRLLDSGADGNVQDLGYAFITVSVDNTDHKLLLRLLDSVGHLKQRITKEIPSVLETLTADPTRSVRLIFDGKPLIDESLECKELGLRQGSTVSCLFESGSTGTEAQA